MRLLGKYPFFPMAAIAAIFAATSPIAAAPPIETTGLPECVRLYITKLEGFQNQVAWDDTTSLFRDSKLGDGRPFFDEPKKGFPNEWTTLHPSNRTIPAISKFVVNERAKYLMWRRGLTWEGFSNYEVEKAISKKLQTHLEEGGRITEDFLKTKIDPPVERLIMANMKRATRMQPIAANATKSERITYANKLLGRSLTEKEAETVHAAHWIGLGEMGADGVSPAGLRNFTKSQLKEKAELLKAAGFTQKERELLMRHHVVGFDFDGFVKTMASTQLGMGDVSGSYRTSAWGHAMRGDALSALTSSALSDAARSLESGTVSGSRYGGGSYSNRLYSAKEVAESLQNAANSVGELSRLSTKGTLTFSAFQDHVKFIGEHLDRAKIRLNNVYSNENKAKVEALQQRLERISTLLKDKKFRHEMKSSTVSEIAEQTIKAEEREEMMLKIKFIGGMIAVSAGLTYLCIEYDICLPVGG